jgi:uncharacterized protein (TIGR02147 family)
MKNDIFEYSDYKAYLKALLSSKGADRGRKAAAAKASQIQATYLSQVLNGHVHLSLEQADLMNTFLMHNEDESHFFLLLVQKNKAGTRKLKDYFDTQIGEIKKRRLVVAERLGKNYSLTDPEKQIYYSSWIYSAVHIATTIPELQTKKKLAEHLNLHYDRLAEVLNFLSQAQLVIMNGENVRPGPSLIHLGNNSSNIFKHHANWRNQAIESLEREGPLDLHYSLVLSLSKEDIEKVKSIFLKGIENMAEIVRPSKEETLYALNIDFFNMNKKV